MKTTNNTKLNEIIEVLNCLSDNSTYHFAQGNSVYFNGDTYNVYQSESLIESGLTMEDAAESIKVSLFGE